MKRLIRPSSGHRFGQVLRGEGCNMLDEPHGKFNNLCRKLGNASGKLDNSCVRLEKSLRKHEIPHEKINNSDVNFNDSYGKLNDSDGRPNKSYGSFIIVTKSIIQIEKLITHRKTEYSRQKTPNKSRGELDHSYGKTPQDKWATRYLI